MRHLILLRHGTAASPVGIGDFDRPLQSRGRRDSVRIGEWLRAQNLTPDELVCSSATRAMETAEHVRQGVADPDLDIRHHRDLYLATPVRILGAVRAASSDAKTVMLVGHNPGMAVLMAELAGAYLEVPTGALAVFQFAGDWDELKPDQADLVHHVVPSILFDSEPHSSTVRPG